MTHNPGSAQQDDPGYTIRPTLDDGGGWQIFDPHGHPVRHRGLFRSKGSAIRRADGLNNTRAMMRRARQTP